VTHIWTQDRAVSHHVAAASLIPDVVDKLEDLIGQVDAVLLARDDAENHLTMAEPFLRAGLPIFIDKPLALTVAEAKQLFKLQQYPGQLFTCSALRFAKELQLTQRQRQRVGKIKHIQATISKDWAKYAIHLIEPVLQLINFEQKITGCQVNKTTDQRVVTLTWADGLMTTFTTLGTTPTPITLVIYGKKSSLTLTFTDTFSAFKSSLTEFVGVVKKRRPQVNQDFVLKAVEVVELGNQ
jgi:predicted dehydrogenase